MAKRQSVRHKVILQPLHPVTFVSAEGASEIPSEFVTSEKIGEKAFGLSCLPKFWTLPFIVVSGELLALYISFRKNSREEEILNHWCSSIISAALSIGIEDQDQIIVRSSGCSEGLEERGKYYSIQGTLRKIIQPLTECLEKLASDNDLNEQKIPLIVQKFVVPISAKGHLSNERRWYKEKRDWLGQYEETKNQLIKPFQINLRAWRKKIAVLNWINKPLLCNLSARVSKELEVPAAWAYEQKLRIHFEWVWDGKIIYLVQADQENEPHGLDPTKVYKSPRRTLSNFAPICLKAINKDHAIKYNKISNVFTYQKLGLPITQIYILDDQSLIRELALGRVSPDLEKELSALVIGSLVIRMDIATEDKKRRQLLPRSDEVRELDKALVWLKEQSAMIKNETQDDVVFIFHNFIPAVSSAFAYAAPGERKVQIEALWGLPEGLYYNSHDKYIVDTKTPRKNELRNEDINLFEVKEKCSCKHFFVTPNEDGHWATETLKPPYDWRSSIQRPEWVREIAFESRRIAEEEGKAISIMWFVGVRKEICSKPIFPWYHEPYDPKITSRAKTHRTKTPFDTSLIIKTSDDIEVLRQEASATQSRVRRIRIQPREEKLLRDKDTLQLIGKLAKNIDAIILLEGGVLSHAYYQLMETGAIVEVQHPFDDFEDKREFNKLVRDKIPSNIEKGGEIVLKTSLSGEALLRALREKLIEEAFEVLDAIDQDSIVAELADVSEIIDGILSHLELSHDDLRKRQDQKRQKAGGFKEGLILLETKNPLPTQKVKVKDMGKTLFDNINPTDTENAIPCVDPDVIEQIHTIDKWSDRKEHPAATEVLLRLFVPMVRDNWTASTPKMVVDSNSGKVVRVKIKGKRVGAKTQIELSIFNPPKQLKLF